MRQEVLIIDDDPAIHNLVAAHLSSPLTELSSAFDGNAGLAMAAERNPSIILLDIDMPRMDGHEVCRQLKVSPSTRSIPIVFLTAAASTTQKIVGLGMGAVDYVTKPFDPLELRARAGAALRLRQDMDSLASRALTDELTGLYSRKGFERHLYTELARARRSGEIDELRQLPIVRSLQGHSNAGSDSVARRRADPFQDLVEGIETPDRRVSFAIRTIQRHRNGVE